VKDRLAAGAGARAVGAAAAGCVLLGRCRSRGARCGCATPSTRPASTAWPRRGRLPERTRAGGTTPTMPRSCASGTRRRRRCVTMSAVNPGAPAAGPPRQTTVRPTGWAARAPAHPTTVSQGRGACRIAPQSRGGRCSSSSSSGQSASGSFRCFRAWPPSPSATWA